MKIKPVTVLLGLATAVVAVSGAGLLIPAVGVAMGTTGIASTLGVLTVVSTIEDEQEVEVNGFESDFKFRKFE